LINLRAMPLDSQACYRAVRARDRRFDGRFFVAVATTRIYCRPICPVRQPKRENMRFYSSAAAAEGDGYRPCLRCHPERAPGMSSVDAASRLAGAAIAGIEEHAISCDRVGSLAAALGVSDRHLRRVTEAELGVSPVELAQTQRLLLAKRLLAETSLKLTDLAFASGFNSVRRFNALFKSRYGMSPGRARAGARALAAPARAAGSAAQADEQPGLRCQLEFRPPLAWERLLTYLRARAIPGVESVDATHYRRTVAVGEAKGWIAVSLAPGGCALSLDVSQTLAPAIGAVIARVKQLFDLDASPDAVSAALSADPLLTRIVRRLPGLRVPGAFDGFELAVRAILGQQVTVKAATTLAGRWAHAFGAPIVTAHPQLCRLTPSVATMAGACASQIASLGLFGGRAKAIGALARAVAAKTVILNCATDVDAQIGALTALPGFGPWTAQYIAMRALRWPDAFPVTDLMLLRAAGMPPRELLARAEAWRPWRAYATHYLWQSLGDLP
jgi:AraC family transcriptional regulator of adaptative response / DNA-3-methyladenine glycosylase II